jgi:hypothetical protein
LSKWFLVVVPEKVLKRRKRLEQIQAERQERLAEQRGKKKSVKAGVTFKKASAFVAEYRASVCKLHYMEDKNFQQNVGLVSSGQERKVHR